MIKITRQTDPKDAYLYGEHFVGEIRVEQLADELCRRLKDTPDGTLFLVAKDDDKEVEEVVGFVVAWIMPGRDYIWVDQCWHHPDLTGRGGKKLMMDGMEQVEKFAKSHFQSKLRMQTPRSTKAWAKSHGYEEIMTVMQKELPK